MKQTIRRQGGGAGGGSGGFTLIEVVLVLAIGGLIFLLAFLAFGQATQNRRDTQRRSDAARIISEVENAQGDGGGKTFTSVDGLGDFVDAYLGGSKSVSGTQAGTFESNNIKYTVYYATSVTTLPDASSGTASVAVHDSRKCEGNGMSNDTGSTGDYAALVKLEKGVACRDNQ